MLQWLFSTYSTYLTALRTQWSHPSLWVTLPLTEWFVLRTTQNNTLLKIKHTLGSEFTSLGTWSGHYPDLLSDCNCQNRLATNLVAFSGLTGNVGVDTYTFYGESDVKACHTGTVHVLNEHLGLLQALLLLYYKHSCGRSWHGSEPRQIHTALNQSCEWLTKCAQGSPTTLCLYIKFDIFQYYTVT